MSYERTGYRIEFNDAALGRMHREAEPGRCYSQQEIAAECGVTRQRISMFEIAALNKLRKRLEPYV